jgi:formate hydrogenlyase transcriptional activator
MKFQTYDWPGNVRELQNVIERAVILNDGETFIVDETWLMPVTPKTAITTVPLVANLIDHEKEMIENALREAEGLIFGPTGRRHQAGYSQTDARIKDQETPY